MMPAPSNTNPLFGRIADIIELARKQVVTAVNLAMVHTYVEIGRIINRYEKRPHENPTIGSLLGQQKNDALIELTLPKDANIYALAYSLYLPDKQLLQQKLMEWTAEFDSL